MNRMNRSGGAICAAVVAVSLLAAGGHVNADERPVSWDNGGPSQLWTETNNWNPNTVGGPANVGILEFLVTVPAGFNPVTFNAISPVEITDFLLGNSSSLVLNAETDLAVLRTAEIAGNIVAEGGNFTAPLDPKVGSAAFTGNRATVSALNGSLVRIAAPAYSSTGLTRSHINGGTWNWTLFSASGPATELDLSAIESIDASFHVGCGTFRCSHNHQHINVSDGAMLNLSGVETVLGPTSLGSLRFSATGAGSVLDMSTLGTITAPPARVYVDIADGGRVRIGSLQACSSVTITLNSATDRFEVNDFLRLGDNITITAPAGGMVSVGGDFLYTHENTADLSLGLATVECVGDLQQLEVGGMDRDVEWQLIPDDNFGFEQLIIGQAGHASRVELVDLHDNLEPGLADALYLWGNEVSGKRGLRILGDSTLVIGDLNVYVLLDLNQLGVMEKIRIRDLFPVGQTVVRFDGGFISLEVPPHLGDMNCDGVFNGGDIDPFFLALGDPAAYVAQFPKCNILNGDMNRDGTLNGGDIDPFFARLGGGSCP